MRIGTHQLCWTFPFPVLILFLLMTDCGNEKRNPIAPQHDHFNAEGIVLIDSGVRFFRMFRGQIDTAVGKVDTLIVPIGLTSHWEIKFLDDNETEIDPPGNINKRFGWAIADPSLLEVYQHEDDEWEFHLRGKKEGDTSIEFRVIHNDHTDFRTLPIPVSIRDIQ